MRPPPLTARQWLAIFGAWTVLTVILILRLALYLWHTGQPFEWTALIIGQGADWYATFAFAPIAGWLMHRFAFERGDRRRAVVLIGAATMAYVPLKYAVLVPLLRPLDHRHPPLGYREFLTTDFLTDVLVLGAVSLGVYGVELYRRVQQGQLERARLGHELAEARLQAPWLQLQPHFLFNTLNSVAALIDRAPRAAEEMLVALSEMLHLTLHDERQQVALETELAQLDRYLGIMRHRFGDALATRIDVDAAARRALVPRFVLQPLVENAIEHGCAQRDGAGQLAVVIRRRGPRLEIDVEDDGPGFTTAREGATGDGIGLMNTRRRLEQLYGPAFEVRIGDRDGGARVTVAIPYREAESVA